jgi:hypothetical protein
MHKIMYFITFFKQISSRYVFSCVICFRFIHFILISTAHALFLTCLRRYTGWKRIYNPEMAGFKISWFWPSTKIILHLNKITECLKITTFKIVFTFDVFFCAETTTYIGLVFTSHENRWRHFTDNKSCQIIESILKYKNGFKNNLMYKEIVN